jgi:DNA polymerase bacteriophage-type
LKAAVDLRTAGVYRYVEHESTGIWCAAWSLGGQSGVWKAGERFPQVVLDHVEAGGIVVAHNAAFERLVWNHVFTRMMRGKVFVPPLRAEQMDCTMARCAVLGIPSTLENAGHALRLPIQKDKAGHANMMVLAKPKGQLPDGTYLWNDTPERLALQYRYCSTDVAAETGIDERVPALPARERLVWELDQKINDRGILIDVNSVVAAQKVVDAEKDRIDAELARLTSSAVTAVSQVKRITDWLRDRGHDCVGLGKDVIRKLRAACAGDATAMAVLDARAEGGKASTAKLKAMLACICQDGRARGLLAYHGTSTGRWAGRLIQPQNLYRADHEEDGPELDMTLRMLGAVHAGTLSPAQAAEAIHLLTGQPAMTMIAKCLRSMFIAQRGMRFVGGDKSNIEGRVAAWLTGEQWKVEAFRAYDEKRGPDLYRVAYARSFGVADPATVSGQRRQVGKVTELSLQYQGSVGAWIKMAANYGVTPAQVGGVVRQAVTAHRWGMVEDSYERAQDRHGLPREEWVAIKLIVTGWRDAHPRLVQGWWDLQDAAIEAVANPGVVVPVFGGRIRYVMARDFLWCSLPSGRVLAYFDPKVVAEAKRYFETPDGAMINLDSLKPSEMDEAIDAGWPLHTKTRRRVDYEGYEGEKKRWATMNLYGGMQFNHIVQGTARDLMVEDMLEAERRGYPTVLTVHDELLTECPDGFGSADELAAIMSTVPAWIEGDLPLAAKAWEGVRYDK